MRPRRKDITLSTTSSLAREAEKRRRAGFRFGRRSTGFWRKEQNVGAA